MASLLKEYILPSLAKRGGEGMILLALAPCPPM